MDSIIKNFPAQFAFQPEIKNKEKLIKPKCHIVVGMGGSHLAADLLKIWDPYLPLLVHKNYDLPKVPNEILKQSLIIISSYSGNTEEILDAYKEARKKNIPLAAISTGGKLLEWANHDSIPYIQIPDTAVQSRFSLGFSIKALIVLAGLKKALAEITALNHILKPQLFEKRGRELARALDGYVPIIYASEANEPIAYNWKIKFNETSKIPAFYNVLPELNHNEMAGFDTKKQTKTLSEKFYFILLKDKTDGPRIQKRMEVLKKLYQARKLPVVEIELKGQNVFDKIFSSLILADWTNYYLAKEYRVEPEIAPIIEEFKKLIK
jgi:glucose/mannose-6-phosphate isomerase